MKALRILLIEDDSDSADAMSELLRHEGYWVDSALTGQKAINLYRGAGDAPYDVILVDLMLPDMDGGVLLRWLAQHAPLPTVVIHTAASAVRAHDVARSVGAATVLRKPTDWGQMRAFLQHCDVVAAQPRTG